MENPKQSSRPGPGPGPVETDQDAVNLAKHHLSRLEYASSFVLVAVYNTKIDVVMKGDIFQVSGMIKIAEDHAINGFKNSSTRS